MSCIKFTSESRNSVYLDLSSLGILGSSTFSSQTIIQSHLHHTIMNHSNSSVNSVSTANHSSSLINAAVTVTFYTWFGCTLAISIISTLILLLLLASSFRLKTLRTGSRILLIHLMFIQLLICGIIFPVQTVVTQQAITKTLPPYLSCRPFMLFYMTIFYAENWSSVLMAFNRFVAIELPHHYKKWLTKRALAGTMILPWLIGFGSTLPIYFGMGAIFTWNVPSGVCYAAANGSYMIAWYAIGFFVPMALIGTCYIVLFLRLKLRRAAVANLYANRPGAAAAGAAANMVVTKNPHNIQQFLLRKRHIQIAKMLIMSFVFYCLCFVPSPLLSGSFAAMYLRNWTLQLWVGKTLLLCGYACSPVSDILFSRTNRRYTKTRS